LHRLPLPRLPMTTGYGEIASKAILLTLEITTYFKQHRPHS
jgi:hypothetical protein